MKVLVTGGLGFVGVNLIDALNRTGNDEVVILDDESGGKRAHLGGLSAEVVIGDIRDEALVDILVRDTEAVVHLAADTRVLDSIADPIHNYDVNVRGSLNILEAMRRHGKRRIAFASTGGAIIGEAEPPLREDIVPRPISPYGASKLAIEGYLSAYRGSYDFLPTAFRFSNVYGPRSFHKGSVVAAFFKAYLGRKKIEVFGDGSQTRDFIYAGDLTSVIINSLRSEQSGVYQLGSGEETSVNTLLKVMSEVIGDDLFKSVSYKPMRKGEVYRTYCDVSFARRELGFNPTTDLRTGLASTWSWFQRQAT